MRYPSWAKARKMMKNITANPARSLAQAPRVDDSCVMVLLKLMYLKIYKTIIDRRHGDNDNG